MPVTLYSRLIVAALVAASLCVVVAATPASAQPAPSVDAAVAIRASDAAGIGAVCSRLAKRKVLRAASSSSATASARTAARAREATARTRRRTRALRHDCMVRRQHGPSNSQSVPLPEAGPLVIGIDGGYAGWSDDEIQDRAALGAAVTRHEWDLSNPVDSEEEQVLAAATEIHTRIHALLGGNDLGDPSHYREWVLAFVRYYGPGGSFWSAHPELDASRYAITTIELGNEPYFGEMSATDYADTVRPALEEIHRLGLPVKVILPSRVYGTDTSWMDTLYQRIPNLNDLFYAFADHPYWYGHDPAQISPAGPFGRIEALRRRMIEQGAGSKPIFITEYGESTASCGSECVSESVQAEHLQAMIAAVTSHPEWGVEMLSVFQLLDRGTDSSDRERQFGLLREDGTPKPAYGIVHAAMQQYRG
jgi:hypothetical protein